MKNYRLLLQYEGGRYQGWQKLGKDEATIQGKLEQILLRMSGMEVTVIGSGRTDAGVHARGQVANVHMETALSVQEVRDYLNRYLPEDIAVLSVEIVPEQFHSRHDAVEKTYEYRVGLSNIPHVFERRFRYDLGLERERMVHLDVEAMREAAALLMGEHDFQGFCGRKIKKKSTVRNIFRINIEEKDDEIRFSYTGNGFLFHMLRIVTGTLLEIGEGRRGAESIGEILQSRERAKAGEMAPAKGLTLVSVKY